MKHRWINNIVIHCTAGFGDIKSLQKFWKEEKKWRSPGYHIVVDLNGEAKNIHPFDLPSNGVQGHNFDSIHIAYIGGVDQNNYSKAKDTRTELQKHGLIHAINVVICYLNEHQPVKNITIKGHRDFSPDRNGDGVIAPWERIKECPSFDAIREYASIQRWICEGAL